jgi:hypothetical protein
MARAAVVGTETFERANVLVAEGKTRTEAFAQIGQERGSRPGTVAANYYRVARAEGQRRGAGRPKRARERRATSAVAPARRPRSAPAPGGTNDIRQVAQQIAELTKQLVRQVEERDKKIRSLVG